MTEIPSKISGQNFLLLRLTCYVKAFINRKLARQKKYIIIIVVNSFYKETTVTGFTKGCHQLLYLPSIYGDV